MIIIVVSHVITTRMYNPYWSSYFQGHHYDLIRSYVLSSDRIHGQLLTYILVILKLRVAKMAFILLSKFWGFFFFLFLIFALTMEYYLYFCQNKNVTMSIIIYHIYHIYTTTDTNMSASYLELHLEIDNGERFKTKRQTRWFSPNSQVPFHQ